MKLKELRIKHNLSQSDLARILNVTSQTILNWENEIHEPSIKKLIEIADYFNVTIDYLVDRKVINQKKEDLIENKTISVNELIDFIKMTIEKDKHD